MEAAREMWYAQRAENHIRRKPVEVPSRAVRVNMQPGRPGPPASSANRNLDVIREADVGRHKVSHRTDD